MATITVTVPSGEPLRVDPGTTVLDVLKTAGSLNGQVVAARVNDRVVDLSRVLSEDCAVSAVSLDSPEGLDVLRHSTAHALAQAVKRLFPDVQITIGPVIADGFYYDFKRAQPFTPEDLERIESVMREIAKQNLPVRREEMA